MAAVVLPGAQVGPPEVFRSAEQTLALQLLQVLARPVGQPWRQAPLP